MLFAVYESPGMNALGWLLEKTLKPDALEFFDKAGEVTQQAASIQWGNMFITLIQIGTVGICASALVKAFGMKGVATLCLWLMVVEMVATIFIAVNV